MSGIISIVIGVFAILYAFSIRYFPEKTRIRKPFRLFSLWNREPFSKKGWKSKYYDDLAETPELQWLYFINYLVTGILFILSGLLAYFLGVDAELFMLVVVAISVVLFTIGRQRITGEVEIGKWVLIGLVVVGLVVSCFI
ncbi:MAG: hypothetical protein IKZ55_11175 [Bacteroidales bacterium]|nr:hypothetical protein [Bacteroidales bacterium]